LSLDLLYNALQNQYSLQSLPQSVQFIQGIYKMAHFLYNFHFLHYLQEKKT